MKTGLYEQLSLFDLSTGANAMAICLWTSKKLMAREAEAYMKDLVPDGEYALDIGSHLLVLRPVPLRADDIRKGHEFYHYIIDNQVYAGIFIE